MSGKPLVVLAVVVSAAGCVTVDPARLDPAEGWIAVRGVPDVRQDSEQTCGAAVLTAALRYWGRETSFRQVLAECPPGPEGIRAGALRDAARGKGLESFVVEGAPPDLEYELAKGRPVIVGTARPRKKGVTTHYELVVGIRPGRDVVLLDPARGWKRTGWPGFLDAWTRAMRTTIVLFPKEESGSRFPTDRRDSSRTPAP